MQIADIKLVGLIFLLTTCVTKPQRDINLPTRSQVHMGTFFNISLPIAEQHLSQEAFAIIADLDQRLSHYQPNSEVSRLNRERKLLAPSAALVEVLQRARELFLVTDGYFDVTIGRLTARFSPQSGLQQKLISVREERAIPLAVMAEKVELLSEQSQIDLGGIGKGFAVDKVAQFLLSNGVKQARIAGSGDTRCFHECSVLIRNP